GVTVEPRAGQRLRPGNQEAGKKTLSLHARVAQHLRGDDWLNHQMSTQSAAITSRTFTLRRASTTDWCAVPQLRQTRHAFERVLGLGGMAAEELPSLVAEQALRGVAAQQGLLQPLQGRLFGEDERQRRCLGLKQFAQ